MGSDPNKRGSGDESDSGEGLQPKSEIPAESPSGESSDSNATIDSVDPHRSDADPSPNDDTANSIGQTLESIKSRDSRPLPNPTPQPSKDGIEETYDSLPRKGENTTRQIEATLESIPKARPDAADDDDLKFATKRQPGLPSHIGRYEIKRLLGEGTFGKVYEARDPQLDRIVAVKVAKAISGRTQVKRFLREARAAAQLRHPRIIPVYEYGQVDGENIIVYEFVAGETLKSYLRRKKNLSLNETVEIVREIADGLNYAHEQGIIHRDMKPDNVLIDPSGHPHIADFGCARSIEDTTHLTIDGSILGTPMYMSPEQAGGRSNIADGRTDIWSLGVMLYEMASGKRPFEGQLSDLLFSICNKDPSPLRKVRPDAPLDIETICSKCLTRDLDKRFATAKVLADELGRFQRGEPIESRRIGTIQRTWMWAKRNQAVAGLISAVVITMLIGTILSTTFAIIAYREQINRAIADRDRERAQMDALTTSEASALPLIFESLKEFRDTILPNLNNKLNAGQTDSEDQKKEQRRLRMAILNLDDDPTREKQLAQEMFEDLLVADPGDFLVCRDSLVCRESLELHKPKLVGKLWDEANDLKNSNERRFRAAAALALYDPNSTDKWQPIAPVVASYLTSVNEIEASKWLESLKPIRNSLKATLLGKYSDPIDDQDRTPERTVAILSSLFRDDVAFLVSLVTDSTPQQIPYLTGALLANQSDAVKMLERLQRTLSQESSAVRKSNVTTALIQLADQNQWNDRNFSGTDMSLATELIERLGPASTPFEMLATQINQWKKLDADALSGILLSLGQYKQNQILAAQKENLLPILLNIFTDHSDSRVHSSARWILQQWGFNDDLTDCEDKLRCPQPEPEMNWHVDLAGNTFALFGPIASFEMGLSKQMASGFEIDVTNEQRHRKSIPRRFGICIHEVTVGQFVDFEAYFINRAPERSIQLDREIAGLQRSADTSDDESKEKIAKKIKELSRLKKFVNGRAGKAESNLKKWAKDDLTPIGNVDFFSALGYCRWLTDQLHIESGGLASTEDLLWIKNSFPNVDFLSTQELLENRGYRLPTATEWEYACRGQSETLFPFGRSVTAAKQYAWYATNSETELHPVGQRKPGNTGLFDVLGNVNEWCLDWYLETPPETAKDDTSEIYVDFGPKFHGPDFENHRSFFREYRGGSSDDQVLLVRSTWRDKNGPQYVSPKLGFRLARTYRSTGVEAPTEITKSE